MVDLDFKIENTLRLIADNYEFAKENGGYVVCFSGGKDSQVLYDLFLKSGVDFMAVYNLTTNDTPENVKFIRNEYPKVEIQLPELNFFQLIEKKKMLPTMNKRFCCEYFKENRIKTGVVVTGVMAEESFRRSKYHIIQKHPKRKKQFLFHPILNWYEFDIWEYIEKEHIKINPTYEEFNRVGCMFCPFASKKQLIYVSEKYPKYKKILLKTIEKIMQKGYMRDFENATPESVFEWWISKGNAKQFFTQLKLF